MKTLSEQEIRQVSGGGDLRRPVDNPESEYGKFLNDAAQVLHDFGSWLGRKAAEITHPELKRVAEQVTECKK